MSWPPVTGEPLPRGGEAFGIEDKLAADCLNPEPGATTAARVGTDGGPWGRWRLSISV